MSSRGGRWPRLGRGARRRLGCVQSSRVAVPVRTGDASPGRDPRRRQRVAAYAVILRDDRMLLTRLAPELAGRSAGRCPAAASSSASTRATRWCARSTRRPVSTPRSARRAGSTPRTAPAAWTASRRVHARADRLRGLGRRRTPRRRTWSRSDGSTVDAALAPAGRRRRRPGPGGRAGERGAGRRTCRRRQRLAAYALVAARRVGAARPAVAPAVETGRWTLPGGGVDHGESPRDALVREVAEETGLDATVGRLLDVDDPHFIGTAPAGGRRTSTGSTWSSTATRRPTGGAAGRRGRRHHRRGRLGAAADIVDGRLPVTEPWSGSRWTWATRRPVRH